MYRYVLRSTVYLGSSTKYIARALGGLRLRHLFPQIIPALPACHKIVSANGQNYKQRDMLRETNSYI